MSSSVSLGSSTAALKITGLSGLKTEEIVSSLMAVERRPLTRLSEEGSIRKDEASALHGVLESLEALNQSAGELASPTVFARTQAVTSSESGRVSASSTGTAAIGAHQVQVYSLATAGQRSFTYNAPATAQTITIDGREVNIAAGMKLSELASAINGNSELSVYAGVIGEHTLVLSQRTTGELEGDYIVVSDQGGALSEVAGSERAGTNAEFSVDGVLGSSSSNTLTEAIPGLTLNLLTLTGEIPVTIDVSPPAASSETLTAAVKAFVNQYNSTLSKLQAEVTTKPAAELQAEAELGTGTLFSDGELEGLLGAMRESAYTPLAGLPTAMASLEDIGISSGKPSSAPTQSELEGKLTIDESKLQEALQTNPEGVRKMLEGFSAQFQKLMESYSAPGGVLDGRIEASEAGGSDIDGQISALDSALEIRQHSLEREYAQLEDVIRQTQAQSKWLSSQLASLSSGSSSSSSSEVL